MKNGWEVKKLGEMCEIIYGGTPDVPPFNRALLIGKNPFAERETLSVSGIRSTIAALVLLDRNRNPHVPRVLSGFSALLVLLTTINRGALIKFSHFLSMIK
jgi:hypothetical protein